jgi:L-threonylcarbamoyladenylate synthase
MKRPDIADGFDPLSIARAVSLLASGEVVAFPTETVYGLGADAYNAKAVAKIFEVKKRPHFDPLIVHIARLEWVEDIAACIPLRARLLMERFWPGPLTIILPKQAKVPDIVTAGLGTVGIRMPRHPVALNLIERLGNPVAAPSANPFGYMSTTKAIHVASLFDNRLPLVLDGGSSSYGIESTIVSLLDEGPIILHRHGSISVEELNAVAGEVVERNPGSNLCEAPGELPYHYAPHTPLVIVSGPEEIATEDSAFLCLSPPDKPIKSRTMRILSPSGDIRQGAVNFFSFLIELDQEETKVIYVQKIPEKGLGRAMMERLRKAAQKSNLVTH